MFQIFFLTIFIYSTICDEILDLKLNEDYLGLTTKGDLVSDRYRVKLDPKNLPPAIRVAISSENATLKNSLTVTVYHGKTVHNIEIPRIQSQQGSRFSYWFASDTLCDCDRTTEELKLPVMLSIASSHPTTFDLRVKSVPEFHIGKEAVTTRASPSEPRYFMYTFPDDVDKVEVKITSSSQLCGRIITRRVDCPLFDSSGLLHQSDIYFYQSFTTFGGFSLRKRDIGQKFHLAVTVMSDDSVCGTQSNTSDHGGSLARIKEATFSVTPVLELSIWNWTPIFVYVIILIAVAISTYYYIRRLTARDIHQQADHNDAVVHNMELFDQEEPVVSYREYQGEGIREYFNFYFFQFFGSILPALTTLFQPFNGMNLDTCYLNYLCYVDISILNSVNGILSASSLAVVGLFNLIIVFRRSLYRAPIPEEQAANGVRERKDSKVACLIGLITMGFLWSITNNCPHKTTIHLYVYTSLWLFLSAFMWIYSKRHGVKKWQQYYIIVVSSAFGFIAMLENTFEMTHSKTIIIKILFSICAVSSTAFFCYFYYYDTPSGLHEQQWIASPFANNDDGYQAVRAENERVFKPLKSKLALISALMVYSVICSLIVFLFPHFPLYSMCFWIGKGQVPIYLVFYIVQKYRFERNTFTKRFMVMTTFLTILFFAGEAFNRYLANFQVTYDILVTPAKSRELNTGCIINGIDWNDIRQYNCALNCIVFILLLDIIDWNLEQTPNNKIFVF